MAGTARSPSLLAGEAESPPGLASGKPEDRLRDREGGSGADMSEAGASTPLSNAPPQGGREQVAAHEPLLSGIYGGRPRPALTANTTRAEAHARLRGAFTEAGLDTPDLDARLLLAEALQVDAVEIAVRPERSIGPEAAERLAGLARRRLAREPVGRMLGRREFWGLAFALSPETLEPRPDTETVVEAALALVPDRGATLRLLDLGTGTGCLLVALLHELPGARGVGLDQSPGALVTARRNAAQNGVAARAAFVASDWTAAIRGRFDLIVANPPYIASSDLAGLPAEVREHDPAAALDGGGDGLAAYRTIFAAAPDLLVPGGALVVEIGGDQEAEILDLAAAAGIDVIGTRPDLAGRPRAVVLRSSGPGRELALSPEAPI